MANPEKSGASRQVDASGDADDMIAYLDRAAAATATLRAEGLGSSRWSVAPWSWMQGAGPVWAAVEMAEVVGAGGHVHAIDPSEAMVRCTTDRGAGLPVHASIGDIRAIDLSDDCCDGARTEGVLIHLTRRDARRSRRAGARRATGRRIALVDT